MPLARCPAADDDQQAFGQPSESMQATPEPGVHFRSDYARPTPLYTGPASPLASKELQDDYFRQQRQLLAFKYETKAEMQRRTFDHMMDGTRQLFADIKTDLFNGIRDLIEQSSRRS